MLDTLTLILQYLSLLSHTYKQQENFHSLVTGQKYGLRETSGTPCRLGKSAENFNLETSKPKFRPEYSGSHLDDNCLQDWRTHSFAVVSLHDF